jgi:hypothetical protein
MLKTAGVAGAALWVTPTVLALDASPAAASTCTCAGGETTSRQFLTLQAEVTPAPLPTTCSTPTTGAVSSALSVCRTDSTHPVYLWGTGNLATGTNNPANGPLFDDMGIVTVTDSTSVTRYGNIYRFQSFCRHNMGNVTTTLVSSTIAQRVYAGGDAVTWDYLPPQPAGTAPQTTDPSAWWTNSQPNAAGTQSTGNPGFTAPAPTWPGPIDISLLFGSRCGTFTVTVANWNRYQQYKWSNIFIGTSPPA